MPPQNVSVVSVTSQSIEIIWDEVSCQGQNGPITGYNVAYRPATESSTSKDSFTTLNTSTVLRDLLPYTNYFITITPINEAGKGNSSFLMQQTNESGRYTNACTFQVIIFSFSLNLLQSLDK